MNITYLQNNRQA